MTLSRWPGWLATSPSIRRHAIKMRRMLWRVQRATPAEAVLLVRRRSDSRLLVLSSACGGMRLPRKQINAWLPIATQIEAWANELLVEGAPLSLVAALGAPGKAGAVFCYAARAEDRAGNENEHWLDPAEALEMLAAEDRRLLELLPAEARRAAGG